MEGSATIRTKSTPLMEAITGQPIPGEPSIIASGTAFVWFFKLFFTSVTNKPEVPLPIFSLAVENTSSPLYKIKSPALNNFSSIAPVGQLNSHTPQPSQAIASIIYFFSRKVIASKRQFFIHNPQLVQAVGLITPLAMP